MIEENKIINKEFELNSQSDELGELFKALATARPEFALLNKDKQAYNRTKYANLASIITATTPALSKNGVTVYQNIIKHDGDFYVETIVGHSSGQYIRRCSPLFPLGVMPRSKSRDEMQDYGTAITYVKKYAYKSVLGIEADVYDDGMDNNQQYPVNQKNGPTFEPVNYKKEETISKDQYQQLVDEFQDDKQLFKDFLVGYNLKKLSDLPKSLYPKAVRDIRTKQETKKMLNK